MPDPVRLRRTIEQATAAFLNTPGRRGRIIALSAASDVLVVGDMHGNVENFRRAMQHAALATHPHRHLVFQELVHGPHQYPIGGDKSHQLVDLLAALKVQHPHQVHMLLGNHELSQWTGQWIAKADAELNDLFRLGVSSAYGAAADSIYNAYERLFAALPLAVRTPNRVFLSHSLPSAQRLDSFDVAVLEQFPTPPNALQPGGSVHALVWGRDTRDATAAAFLKMVDADLLITGHIPCPNGFSVPNHRQLILDSMGTPSSFCLFPSDRRITHTELVACVHAL